MSAETRVPGAVSLERERSICLPPLWEWGMGGWGHRSVPNASKCLNQGALSYMWVHTWGVEWEIFFRHANEMRWQLMLSYITYM